MRKLQVFFIATAALLAAPTLLPFKAMRGSVTEMQGRVVAADSRAREVTVINHQTAEPVKLKLGRDAFEPGQSWKNLESKPRARVVATYNFDGSMQARRVQLF